MSDARDREVLRERARALARPPAAPAPPGEVLPVLLFDLGGEPHALEIRHVLAVMPSTPIAVIPAGPPVLAGVVNYRGGALAVFDPRPLLGLRPGGEGRRVVVVGDEAEPLGLLVDGLPTVGRLRRDALSAGGGLSLGVTESGVVLLDGEALLGDDRLVVDQGTGTGRVG